MKMNKHHWELAVVVILALGWLHALGWSSGPGQALASPSGGGFCQVADAGDLLERLGEQTPVDTITLVVNKQEVEPGGLVQARLVNTTKHVVTFGSEFKIQRYHRMGWKTDSSSPDGLWPRKAGKLPSGRAAACYRFSVPAEQDPGRYRFLTRVDLGSARKGTTADFVIQVGRW